MTWDQPPVSSVLGDLPFLVHFSRWLSGSIVFSCLFSLYSGTLSLCSSVAPIFPWLPFSRGSHFPLHCYTPWREGVTHSLCRLALKPEFVTAMAPVREHCSGSCCGVKRKSRLEFAVVRRSMEETCLQSQRELWVLVRSQSLPTASL